MTWKLPGYVVEDLLGFGGSGEVWRGHVSATGDPVALKRIPVGDAAQLQAARAEAALLSTLDHPHLIRLHEVVPVADAVVLVLDLAAGGSLADLLGHRGRLTPGEVVSALAPIGAALAYAHNEGVVHGDVTPANVLFCATGLSLLADLGVARIVGDSSPAHSTPAYIDPAVAAGCAPGAPSDVFMLAAVAVHALTGTPVWGVGTAQDMLARAAAGEIDDVVERLRDAPCELALVLERALAVEPHLRCTAAEFALDLRHSCEPIPVELDAGRPRELHPVVDVSDAGPAGRRPADACPAGLGSADAGPARGAPALGSPALVAPAVPSGGDSPGRLVADDDPRPAHLPGDPARPMFSRPEFAAAAPAHAGQLTHGVRAALRPAVPARPHRRVGRLHWNRRTGYAVAVVAALGVAVGTGFAWSMHRGDGPAPRTDRPAPATAGVPVRNAGRTLPAPAAPAQPHGADAEAAALLRRLDGFRERAFASRDLTLLSRVYVPGPLLAQDATLLERIVPKGCGLIGVHTAYASVHAAPAGQRLVLTAKATLATSTLTCGAVRSGTAAGEGPTTMRIELAQQGDDYRIVSQQKLG